MFAGLCQLCIWKVPRTSLEPRTPIREYISIPKLHSSSECCANFYSDILCKLWWLFFWIKLTNSFPWSIFLSCSHSKIIPFSRSIRKNDDTSISIRFSRIPVWEGEWASIRPLPAAGSWLFEKSNPLSSSRSQEVSSLLIMNRS